MWSFPHLNKEKHEWSYSILTVCPQKHTDSPQGSSVYCAYLDKGEISKVAKKRILKILYQSIEIILPIQDVLVCSLKLLKCSMFKGAYKKYILVMVWFKGLCLCLCLMSTWCSAELEILCVCVIMCTEGEWGMEWDKELKTQRITEFLMPISQDACSSLCPVFFIRVAVLWPSARIVRD